MQLFRTFGLLGLTLGFLLTTASLTEAKDKRDAVVWPKIRLVPFTIVPQPLEGAPVRADQSAIMQKLSDEATARTERLLLKRHVATAVERVASAPPVSDSATAPVYVTGTVTLPLSLPPGVIGWKARSRKGPFVTTQAQLRDATGRLLGQEQVTLNWGDVWWLTGAKVKRSSPLDEVLRKFTRKSVDRAIEQLQHKLKIRQIGN